MVKGPILIIVVLSVMSLSLIGCQDPQEPENSQKETVDAYPIETLDEYPGSYPIDETGIETSYPVDPGLGAIVQGPSFSINRPLKGGDTTVTGLGPKNVPINLVDVSEVGLIIATTTIKENGTFEFSFVEPLKSRHTVGLMLGDLTGTDFNENDFIYSDEYFVRPLIGILFDMVVVE